MKLLHLLVVALSAAALVCSAPPRNSAMDVLCNSHVGQGRSICKDYIEPPPKVHPPPKKIHPPPPKCVEEWEDCSKYDCCKGLICNKDTYYCEKPPPPCVKEGGDCSKYDCCKDLVCNKYKECVKPPPPCVKEGGDCSKYDCCKGLVCNKYKECVKPPPPCQEEWEDCSKIDCCKGLVCVNKPKNCYYKHGKKICDDYYVCDKPKKG